LFLLACTARPTGQRPPDADTGSPTDSGGPDGGSPDSGSPGDGSPDGGAWPPLRDLDIGLQAARHNPLAALVTVRAVEPVQVSATAWEGGRAVATATATAEPAGRSELALVGLHADTRYWIEVQAELPDGSTRQRRLPFTTPSLPANLRPPTVQIAEIEPAGLTVYSNGSGPFQPGDAMLAGVDGRGEVAWVYTSDQALPERDVSFDRQPDGALTVVTGEYLRTIDLAGRTLTELRAVDTELPGFHHAAWRLPEGWAVLSWEEQTLTTPAGADQLVVGDVVAELDDSGAVLSRWSTFDHLDTSRFPNVLSTNPSLLDDRGLDWTHANALLPSADGQGWLLSLRSQSWILQFDRSSGDLDWVLGQDGDFSLSGGTWFDAQHGPEREDDGSIWVFDNRTTRLAGDDQSRVVHYDLDQAGRTATERESLPLGVSVDHLGDVDLLDDGHLLVCVGAISSKTTMHGTAELRELDPTTGEQLWVIELPEESFSAERVPLP